MNANETTMGSLMVLVTFTLLWASAATAEGPDGQMTTRQLVPGERLTTEQLVDQLHEIGIALTPEQQEQHRRTVESQLRT